VLLVNSKLLKDFGDLFNNGLWGKFIKLKYFNKKLVEEWIRLKRKLVKGALIVSRSLVKYYPLVGF